MQARTMIVYDLLMEHGAGRDSVPTDITLDYAIQHIENADGKVREYSKKILIEFYNTIGEDKVKPFLTNLRPKQAEALQEEFDKQGGNKKRQ